MYVCRTLRIVDNAERHVEIHKIKGWSLRGKKQTWETEEAGERNRQGGSATCDQSQVRVRTRFALDEDKLSFLPAVRKIGWTRVHDHQRSVR